MLGGESLAPKVADIARRVPRSTNGRSRRETFPLQARRGGLWTQALAQAGETQRHQPLALPIPRGAGLLDSQRRTGQAVAASSFGADDRLKSYNSYDNSKTATSTIIGENHHFPTRISKKRRRKWIRKATRYEESKMEQRTVSGGKDAPLLCGWGFKIRILTNSTKTRRRERERERHLILRSSPGFEILLFCACLSSAAFGKKTKKTAA